MGAGGGRCESGRGRELGGGVFLVVGEAQHRSTTGMAHRGERHRRARASSRVATHRAEQAILGRGPGRHGDLRTDDALGGRSRAWRAGTSRHRLRRAPCRVRGPGRWPPRGPRCARAGPWTCRRSPRRSTTRSPPGTCTVARARPVGAAPRTQRVAAAAQRCRIRARRLVRNVECAEQGARAAAHVLQQLGHGPVVTGGRRVELGWCDVGRDGDGVVRRTFEQNDWVVFHRHPPQFSKS